MKNKSFFLFATVCIMCVNACNIEVKKDNKTNASSNEKIRNGISIQENGLHVQQAFLLKDDGSLIDDNNKTKIGERIGLRLITEGWKENNGVVNFDASEKIITNDGVVVIDENNLFSEAYPNGIKAEDAKYLTLYARISRLDKLYDYFLVSFKVWDKATNKSFSGSYKFYI